MSIRFFVFFVLCGLLRPDAYTEEEAKKTSSTGSPSLVRDQGWPKEERHSDVELDLDNTEPASFQRPIIPVASSYCLQNVSSHGTTGMEMRGLPNYESQEGGILPILWRPLANMLRGGQLLELVSEQCSAILTTAKKWQCEEKIPEAVHQRDIQRQGKGRQRKQGEGQILSSSRGQSCFPLFSGGSVLTTAAIYSTLAGHGLLSISDSSAYSRYSCESESNQPVRPRAYPGDPESVPRGISHACTSQRSTGKSGGIRCKTDNQRPPCGNVRFGESKTCLSRSFGGPQAAQKWMDETLGGESCGLGETIGHLSDKLCATPGRRVKSPSRCCQCQAQYSAAELPDWEQRSRRSSTGRRARGPDRRQGGGKSKTTASSSHAELHGFRWCRGEASRNHGDPFRYRKGLQTAKISRSNTFEAGYLVNVGQTPPCQKKDGVAQANLQWFEDVEAYRHCPLADGAACMPKPTVLTTAQACVHRHSVQDEPDFVSEHRAALNAFVLSWQVNVMSFGARNGLVRTHSLVDHIAPTLPSCRIKSKTLDYHQHRRIRFEETVDLHIFEEHSIKPVPPLSFGTSDLNFWNNKPWKLRGTQQQAESRSQPHVSDLWCAASGPWPHAPPTRKCRLLDDHLSHTVDPDDIEDPGLFDLENHETQVFFDEEEDLQFYLASDSLQDGTPITLEMYGLIITHHSIRVATTDFDMDSIRETIRQAWTDVTPRNSLTNAFLLKPQDLLGSRTIQLLIEIVPPEIRIPVIDVPILRRTKWYSDDSTSIETAYMRDSQTGYELLIDAGHAEWCFSSQNIQCNLHIEGRIAFLSLRHPLRQGAVLSYFIHDDWVAHDASNQDTAPLNTDETSLIDLSMGLEGNSASGTPGPHDKNEGCDLGGLEIHSVSGTPDPLICTQINDENGPSLREVKPNTGIPPDLDGFVPHRQRTSDGQVTIGRTIAPPNWQMNRAYRFAAESGSLFRDDADDLRVRIRSWIASVRTQLILPHRDFTIRAQLMGDLEIKIRRAWRDQILQTDRIKFTVVRPSPNIGYTGRRPLHVLIELNRPHNSQLHPILIAHREITARGPVGHAQWVPVLVATPIGRTTLHNICAPPCRSDQMLVPMPGRVRRWMSQENGRPIYAGLFLPIWWDVRIQPPPNPAYEEDDQQVLMQIASASFGDQETVQDNQGGNNSDFPEPLQITGTSPTHELCCHQLLVQKLSELETNREGLRICSHGLSGTSIGSRYFVISDAQPLLLQQAIRSNWPEFQDAQGFLHLVHPQPQDTLRPSWRTCIHIVVEFFADEVTQSADVAPGLEESVIWTAYGTASIKHEACYFPRHTHFQDIAEKFGHLCDRASFRCIVRVAVSWRNSHSSWWNMCATACTPSGLSPSARVCELFLAWSAVSGSNGKFVGTWSFAHCRLEFPSAHGRRLSRTPWLPSK